jgi:hypothetical protein
MTSTDHKLTFLSRSQIVLYFYTTQTTMTEKQRKKVLELVGRLLLLDWLMLDWMLRFMRRMSFQVGDVV